MGIGEFCVACHALNSMPCVLVYDSLVPRLFPPPVFDCLQFAKTVREGLGERVTCMTSGSHEDRREGGGAR